GHSRGTRSVHAVDRRWWDIARLVHRDGIRGSGGSLRGRAVDLLLSRNGSTSFMDGAARNRQAFGDRAVLRRHRLGVWLAARVLPDSEGAARERDIVGTGSDRRRLYHRRRVFACLLVPRRASG